jgi:transmembrane sensor
MTWASHHDRSAQLASIAQELLIRGETDRSREFYFKAAEAEEQALAAVDPSDKPRTFAITAVSAGALWYKAKEFARARDVAHRSLKIESLAPFAVKELTELLELTASKAGDRPAHAQTRSSRVRRRWAAAAAVLIVALILGPYLALWEGWFAESYATKTGETRTLTLQEGSVVYLNTRTKLYWLGSGQDRRVRFETGEALFDVVENAKAPFRVVLDDSEIRVLGTRFNVRRDPRGDTIVTVLEGVVQVRGSGDREGWERTVRANENIAYRSGRLISEPKTVDPLSAVSWRSGVLQFDALPLEKVVEELARYTDKRIVFQVPSQIDRPITGKLPTRNVDEAFDMLEQIVPIQVTENAESIIIEPKNKSR